MEPHRFTKRPRRHLPTHSRKLVAEAALECHDEISAVLYVVGEAAEERVTRNIEWRDQNYFVIGQVRDFGKNEIDRHIRVVERGVHLPHDRAITLVAAEWHELNSVIRIVAIQNGNLVFAMN